MRARAWSEVEHNWVQREAWSHNMRYRILSQHVSLRAHRPHGCASSVLTVLLPPLLPPLLLLLLLLRRRFGSEPTRDRRGLLQCSARWRYL